MKRFLLALGLAAALCPVRPLAGEEELYRSNALGLLLGPARPSGEDYLLRRVREPLRETDLLVHENRETRRWERTLRPDGKLESVLEYSDGQPTGRRMYDETGALVEELRYADGKPVELIRNVWTGGSLGAIEYEEPPGELRRRDLYLYAAQGELREVRRSWSDGRSSVSRYSTASGRLLEEYHSQAGADVLVRYDARGRLAERREWKTGALVSASVFSYVGTAGVPAEEAVRLDGEGRRIVRRFDAAGRVVEQETFSAGRSIEKIAQRYEGGRLVSRRQLGTGSQSEAVFSYDSDGNLVSETLSDASGTVKRTVHFKGGERAEERYRQGRLVLRLYYRGERVVREEIIRDGEVVRVRGEGD